MTAIELAHILLLLLFMRSEASLAWGHPVVGI